jgi:hypothetical protein
MKKWTWIVAGLLGAALLATALVYQLVYNRQHPDYEQMDPAFILSAGELFQAYADDKVSASRRFDGKVIAIDGKLSKIEDADSMVTAVFVFRQGDFGDEGVRCTMLQKFNNDAARLQPDGEVKIKGYCTGYNDTDVILEKCSIVPQ